MPIPYDPSRAALLHPGLRPTVLQAGDAELLTLEAICAECSRLVYLHFESSDAEQDVLLSALGRIGATDFRAFNDAATGTQGFGVVLSRASQPASRHALVVFRGTEPDRISDLAADLEASAVEGPGGGTVHAGFRQAFFGVRQAVDDWLSLHGEGVRVFTGHSLGAALATLAAAQWPGARLVTFGSPRVGNEAFRHTVTGKVTRYVDCSDIVSRVPPETPWYTHVAAPTYIDRNGVVHAALPPASIDSDRATARVEYLEKFAWRSGTVLVRDLADHSPINYVRALIRDR
jgi:hypothetical protein